MMKKFVKHTVRCLKWLGIGIVALAALLTAYFYIGGIEWGDWTIPDEKELRLELRDVPDEDNAYLALIALTNVYNVAGADVVRDGGDESGEATDIEFTNGYVSPYESGEREARVKRALDDPAAHERAERILSENERFFEAFRAALLRNGYLPKGDIVRLASSVSILPPSCNFVRFAQLVALKAQISLERGDADSAVSDIRAIHALGRLVSSNVEGHTHCLIGRFIENVSCKKMCDAVAMGRATPEHLEIFGGIAEECEVFAPTDHEMAIKVMFADCAWNVEWFSAASGDSIYRHIDGCFGLKSQDTFAAHVKSAALRILWNWPGYAKFAIHPRETRWRIAEFARVAMCKEALPEESLSSRFYPNWLGEYAVDMSSCGFNAANAYFKGDSLLRARARLVIASEKWRRAHGGENPPTLEALVPDYLAAVPADPRDKTGAPLKYDAASGVAWSVGRKGTYDYLKVAKDRTAGSESSLDKDTQIYAFRIDGKPVERRCSCAALSAINKTNRKGKE